LCTTKLEAGAERLPGRGSEVTRKSRRRRYSVSRSPTRRLRRALLTRHSLATAVLDLFYPMTRSLWTGAISFGLVNIR